MVKSSLLLILVVWCSLSVRVISEKKSSSFENEFTKSNQQLIKLYPQLKHLLAVRQYSRESNEAKSHVNEDESDQTIPVRRDDKFPAAALETGGYGIGYVGPVYSYLNTNSKPNFKWGITDSDDEGVQYGLAVE